jgi:hypothetical protein
MTALRRLDETAGTQPQTTTRLLDWFEPIHDPDGLISRTVLRLDQLAARRGVRLYPQTDFHGLKAVAEANRHHGTVLAPNVDPDLSQVGPKNAIWLYGIDGEGRAASTQTGRYFDWTGTSLAAELESFRFFYETPINHLTADSFCRMPRPAAELLSGPVLQSGTIWVRPDLRGPDGDGIVLSRLLGRLTRMIGIALWWPDFVFTFSTNDLYKRGVVTNFGWQHQVFPAEWKLADQPIYSGGLFWMTREEMLDWARRELIMPPVAAA